MENKKELNPYILLVMKWLNDKDSVTQDELVSNSKDAAAAAAAYAGAAYTAAGAAGAAYAAAGAAGAADKWVTKYFERTSESKQDYIDTLNQNDFKAVIARPQPQPVFTQEMHDNEENPLAGMMCLFSFDDDEWQEVTIDFIGEKSVVVSMDGYKERHYYIEDVSFKPLPTPVNLDDGAAYQFDISDTGKEETLKEGIYCKDGKAFHTPYFTYTASKCANIQKLTVEVV